MCNKKCSQRCLLQNPWFESSIWENILFQKFCIALSPLCKIFRANNLSKLWFLVVHPVGNLYNISILHKICPSRLFQGAYVIQTNGTPSIRKICNNICRNNFVNKFCRLDYYYYQIEIRKFLIVIFLNSCSASPVAEKETSMGCCWNCIYL